VLLDGGVAGGGSAGLQNQLTEALSFVGLAIVPQGQIMGALGFTFSGGKVTGIDMISEPGRLQDVDLAVPGP